MSPYTGNVMIYVKGSENLKYVDHTVTNSEEILAIGYADGVKNVAIVTYNGIAGRATISDCNILTSDEILELPKDELIWLLETKEILLREHKNYVKDFPRENFLLCMSKSESLEDILEGGERSIEISLRYFDGNSIFNVMTGEEIPPCDVEDNNYLSINKDSFDFICSLDIEVKLPKS